MGDAPEQEHNRGCREQGTHGVDHTGHIGRVANKLGEQVGGKHEERCTGWVTDFKFITC